MTPFPTSHQILSDTPIYNGHPTQSNQNTPQRLPMSVPRSSEYSNGRNHIPNTVDEHEAVDKFLIRGGGWELKLEVVEGTSWSEEGIDAEAQGEN